MINLFYFTPFCLLRPTTNRIFVVRVCDALAGKGVNVFLFSPLYKLKDNISIGNLRNCYNIKNDFSIKILNMPLTYHSSKYWQIFILNMYYLWLTFKIFIKFRNEKIVFAGDHKLLLFAVVLKKLFKKSKNLKVIGIIHEVEEKRIHYWLYKNYDSIWVTTSAAKEKLKKDLEIAEERFACVLACQISEKYPSKYEARKIIGYSSENPLIVYTGKLGRTSKEVFYLIETAGLLPNYNFVFTGGAETEVQFLKTICIKKNIRNISFTGFINEISYITNYQAAADVLISYYTEKDHLVEFNFPQKLIEYMISGNPIVTPDFPATRELINANTAMIVEPDNPVELAKGIKKLIENKALSEELAGNARREVQKIEFNKKADEWKKVLESI